MNTKTPTQKLHLAIGIISTIFILVFILQNTEVVTVNFLFWKIEMSRVILILVLLLVGFLLGYILRSRRRL
ncbi:MAG: lipopolysaccharide assembly protein LapA domain-containing protein [Gammaproteobacteria bacterium]|nr:lipopolysaccharide assembly protein LapA domain-containing protein [Gammaproteobacteria bacterium]